MDSRTFDDAFALLRLARDKAAEASQAENPDDAEAYYKSAYYHLYKCVSLGHSLFSASLQNGFGSQGGVFSQAEREFEVFSRIVLGELHQKSAFKKDQAAVAEFEGWLLRARDYLNCLAAESGKLRSIRPSVDTTAWKVEHRNGWDSRSLMLE